MFANDEIRPDGFANFSRTYRFISINIAFYSPGIKHVNIFI